MIGAIPDYLPARLSSPTAIIREYESANRLAYPDTLSQLFVSTSDKGIVLNRNNYNGFENMMLSFNLCKEDAIDRFKQIYKTNCYDTVATKPFLDTIQTMIYNLRSIPRFSFYLDGAAAVFNINQREITVEYDFDEPEFVFVSKYIDDVLHIKDTSIDDLPQVFGSFL